MNQAMQDMLARYDCRCAGDYENALREIFQELALLGLWRGKFFEHAAFYGGTALRILYGLDRFSEDMDFSLLTPNDDFDFSPYCSCIEKELSAWGFPVTVELKKKTATSAVESAFLKAGTVEQMLLIDVPDSVLGGIPHNQRLKIKVEVDTQPPPTFQTTSSYLLQPIPFAVRSYTLPSLFAGKMHALLFRKWGQRVKGRDWYDLVWYVARKTPLDLQHFAARMRQTGQLGVDQELSEAAFRGLLEARILEIDWDSAKRDVEPFLKNSDAIALWSSEFFQQVSGRIELLDR